MSSKPGTSPTRPCCWSNSPTTAPTSLPSADRSASPPGMCSRTHRSRAACCRPPAPTAGPARRTPPPGCRRPDRTSTPSESPSPSPTPRAAPLFAPAAASHRPRRTCSARPTCTANRHTPDPSSSPAEIGAPPAKATSTPSAPAVPRPPDQAAEAARAALRRLHRRTRNPEHTNRSRDHCTCSPPTNQQQGHSQPIPDLRPEHSRRATGTPWKLPEQPPRNRQPLRSLHLHPPLPRLTPTRPVQPVPQQRLLPAESGSPRAHPDCRPSTVPR